MPLPRAGAGGRAADATVGAIQRQLLVLENQGAGKFFGEPSLAIKDLMTVDRDGRGTINLLARELGYPADAAEFARRISAAGNRCRCTCPTARSRVAR